MVSKVEKGRDLGKIPVVLDVETSDPDDLMTLLFLGGHPRVQLKAVLVSPGTPAQLLLVDAALNMISERVKYERRSSAVTTPADSTLKTIPIGYFDLDLVVPNGDDADRKDGDYNPFRDTRGKIYEDLFPDWVKEVKTVFYDRKGGPSKPKASVSQTFEKDVCQQLEDSARPAHQRLKTYTMQKFAKAERPVDEGWKILCEAGGEDVVLVTGGPVWNLGKAVKNSLRETSVVKNGVVNGGQNPSKILKLRKWCAQGGFAGHNALVGMERAVLQRLQTLLPRFSRDTTNPAWNFDLSHTEAIAALEYSGIAERWICSKNVCHRVVYDTELHNEIGEMIAQGNNLPCTSAENDTAQNQTRRRWKRDKKDVGTSTTDVSPAESVNMSTEVGKDGAAPRRAHPGLTLFHRMMELYRKKEQKKLHDLLPALAAIDPALTGCTFRQARLEWVRGGNRSFNDKNANQPSKSSNERTKSGERVFPSPNGRWKNGGEWGCVGVGKWIDFSLPSEFDTPTMKNPSSLNSFNVWISVDVNIESFRRGLLRSE